VTLEALATKHTSALDSMGEIPAPRAYPGGAHVAEVEIDPETGEMDILRYTAADDCGRVLNHTLLEGQIHGGIVQGLGQVVGEHCQYDAASGQLLTGSFMDYVMPRIGRGARRAALRPLVPSPSNPLGVKGAGEAGTTARCPPSRTRCSTRYGRWGLRTSIFRIPPRGSGKRYGPRRSGEDEAARLRSGDPDTATLIWRSDLSRSDMAARPEPLYPEVALSGSLYLSRSMS
jgi:hypothetical protein